MHQGVCIGHEESQILHVYMCLHAGLHASNQAANLKISVLKAALLKKCIEN